MMRPFCTIWKSIACERPCSDSPGTASGAAAGVGRQRRGRGVHRGEAAPESPLFVVRGDDDRDVGRAIH
jgi:hypothetical protein